VAALATATAGMNIITMHEDFGRSIDDPTTFSPYAGEMLGPSRLVVTNLSSRVGKRHVVRVVPQL